ncbi:MAG TPA: 30S ribosomal protein S9 [Anaerolineales bacterium]|nr:30S ribosomal protein S9 [Anaerolineales bacterium]
MANQYYEGVGRRKRSTARVRLESGSGKVVVNGKDGAAFFTRPGDLDTLLGPLRASGLEGKFDVSVVVNGGGVTGQTDAARRGLALALVAMDPDLRPAMRAGKFLTQDARVKERKKPGLKRARKAPTYTKR